MIGPRLRAWLLIAAVLAAMVAFTPGCNRKPPPLVQPQQGHIMVDYVDAGTEALAPVDYSVDPHLEGAPLADYALTQLLAGPATGRDTIVLFPQGTTMDVAVSGDTATVNIAGPLVKGYQGGADDESAMFKSLTYTLTNIPGIARVQVLIGGQKRAALAGGHMELDEPLTRETFAQ
jgi:spore germination protein GerM